MAAGDLTDLPTVKAWLGVTTTTYDDQLSGLITAVSSFIANYLGRQLLTASYVETYRGNGQRVMVLRNFPITAVASVAFAGQTITAAADPVALTSGILFDDRTLHAGRLSLPDRPAGGGQLHGRLCGDAGRRRPGRRRAGRRGVPPPRPHRPFVQDASAARRSSPSA